MALKKWIGVGAVALFVACSGVETVTGPEQVSEPATPVVSSNPTPAPQTVAGQQGITCDVGRDGYIVATNLTDRDQTFYGFSTAVDQSLLAGVTGPVVVEKGKTFKYQGVGSCSQVDIAPEPWPNYNHVYCAAWYNKEGMAFSDPRKVDWAACAPKPTPKPSPSPSPSPSPEPECEPEFSTREVVTFGEWGACNLVQSTNSNNQTLPGLRFRSKTVKAYTTSSCTEQEELTSTTVTQESESCLPALVHTQNDQWCWVSGEFNGLCSSLWLPGKVKKWQCQNVPPASNGHYDNHFGKNGHDDFFGTATESKCYSITN